MAEIFRSPSSCHLRHRQQSQNRVLFKDEVGKGKPSSHNLPPKEHAYGKWEPASPSGARDAFMWQPHKPSAPATPPIDYQRLNKAAVSSNATTPEKLAQFRMDVGDMRRLPSPARSPARAIPSDVIPGWAYGRPGRPSTPIRSVIAHQDGNAWEEALEERYRKYENQRAACDGKLRFKLTKAAGSRRRPEPEQPPDASELWKMSKFQKVVPRLQKEAPLVRDSEGRLQRQSSPAVRRCTSLPHLTQAAPDRSEEEILGSDGAQDAEVETETETESESNWTPGTPIRERLGLDQERRSAMESDTMPAAEPGIVISKATTQEGAQSSANCVTDVTIGFTVLISAQEQLGVVAGVVERGIRSNFTDTLVKVRGWRVEQPRQGLREKRQRYVAWGQGALESPAVAENVSGTHAASWSPLGLCVTVRHKTPEELKQTTCSLVECVQACFPADSLQVRKVSPPLWEPPPRSPAKPRVRDGLGRPLPRSQK